MSEPRKHAIDPGAAGQTYDKDAAYREIKHRNDLTEAFLHGRYTEEERQKIIEANYRGAD